VRGREAKAVQVYEVSCANGALLRLRRLASGNVQISLDLSAEESVCLPTQAELDTGAWSALMNLREDLWPIRPRNRNRKKKDETLVS
jgi:hypothetical protein